MRGDKPHDPHKAEYIGEYQRIANSLELEFQHAWGGVVED